MLQRYLRESRRYLMTQSMELTPSPSPDPKTIPMQPIVLPSGVENKIREMYTNKQRQLFDVLSQDVKN